MLLMADGQLISPWKDTESDAIDVDQKVWLTG